MRYLGSRSGFALALGMILLVVGVVTNGIAVAAIGIIVLLTGLYARSREVRDRDR